MSSFIVITVPADGLAPLGAKPSAGSVMTHLGFRIDKKPGRERVKTLVCFTAFLSTAVS